MRALFLQAKPLMQESLRLLRSEEGATLVEYTLLLALIAIVCSTALTTLGCNLAFTFQRAGGMLGS